MFTFPVEHVQYNLFIQWQFATLAKLKIKTLLSLLQAEYSLCYEALNIYIESSNVYANF
jgi:hypothetical protein